MRNKIYIIFIWASMLVSMIVNALSVDAIYSAPFEYELEDECATITGCNIFTGYEPIPSTIDGYPVTKIGNRAFYGFDNEESVLVLPEGVQVIEDEAFLGVYEYGFRDVTVPKSVIEIGKYAFGYTLTAEFTNNDEDYIERVDETIIRGYSGTIAEVYADENDFTFIALNDEQTSATVTATTTTATSSTTLTETSSVTVNSTTVTTSTTMPTTSTPSSSMTILPDALYGDINSDAKVSVIDIVHLNKYNAEMILLNEQQLRNADCNADGTVNSDDIISLMRFMVQLIDALPEHVV